MLEKFYPLPLPLPSRRMVFPGSGLIGDYRMCLEATMVAKLGIYKFLRDNHIEIKKESSIPIDCTYFINSIWQALDRYLTVNHWNGGE